MIINEAVELEPAIPKKWGFTNSKEKGTPGFWMDFDFTKISGDGGEIYSVKKTWWITEKTIEYVLKDLDTLGWHGKDLKELEDHDFRGPGVLLTVEMTESKGKMYPNVTWVNPLDYTPQNKAMEASAVKDISAKMKGAIAAYRAKNSKAA